jgi:hypothetical protein
MARRHRPNLTEEEREGIRALHHSNPRMRYKEIAAIFRVTQSCVCQILNSTVEDRKALPKPAPVTKAVMRLPTCVVKQPDSIISAIPLARLMAGC